MPEFEAAPFPPMPVLRGAVPGWPPDDPLTSVNTPDAARMALRAQSETSVLDPRGLRRLWWRDVHFLLAIGGGRRRGGRRGAVLRSDFTAPVWWLLRDAPECPHHQRRGLFGIVLSRALPAAGVVPRPWPARWRWYRQVRREPVARRRCSASPRRTCRSRRPGALPATCHNHLTQVRRDGILDLVPISRYNGGCHGGLPAGGAGGVRGAARGADAPRRRHRGGQRAQRGRRDRPAHPALADRRAAARRGGGGGRPRARPAGRRARPGDRARADGAGRGRPARHHRR